MLYQRVQKNSKACCSNMLKSINAEDLQLYHHKRRRGKDTSTLHQLTAAKKEREDTREVGE